MDDADYQNGIIRASHDPEARSESYECTGHGIYEYFLPLMTILGEIVNLRQPGNRHLLGDGVGSGDDKTREISRHLELYEWSLQNQKATEAISAQSKARIVTAYGTYLLQIFRLLLTRNLINGLDDKNSQRGSEGFATAIGHVVSATEALRDILELDPGLALMPFFFGIYILHGSFWILRLPDKLEPEIPSKVKLCEINLRAHQACVLALESKQQVSNLPVVSRRERLTAASVTYVRSCVALLLTCAALFATVPGLEQCGREILALCRPNITVLFYHGLKCRLCGAV
jgi:hypothetical protein